MASNEDTVPSELPRSAGTQDANTSRRRRSLPGRSTSVPRQRPSSHAPPMPPASPEIISSLISSLSSISTPARSHFDSLPHIGAQTAPSSPGFHQTEFPQSQGSGQGFGVDYGAYKPPSDAFESPFLHPDDAALSPVVRMAPAPTPSSPRSPRSPKFKTSFGRDRSPRPRSTSSFSSSQAAMEEQSLSGFGIITTEPGTRVSRTGSVASTNSDGRKSLRSPLSMLRRGSKDSWQDKEAERSNKSSAHSDNLKPSFARSRASLQSKNSMADVAEEGGTLNPAEDLSFKSGKAVAEIKSSSHTTPNPPLPSPGGIGSGRIIPTRESSLRHSMNNKPPRKSRHSRPAEQRSTTGKERSHVESKTSEARAATEQTTKRIQQVKEQQKRIKNELAKAQEVPAGRTSIETFNSRAKTTQPAAAEATSARLSQDEALISRYLIHAETDPFEESAPSPAVQTRRTREAKDKKRQSLDKADIPLSPSTSKAHKRHSSGAFTMATRPSIAEERPSSADSIDLAVESYIASPRLTQKVPHPRSGRMIAFSEVGDPQGHVIFCCLGMGLTRYLMAFYDELARTLKLRLVTLDRPGVGESDPSGEGEGTPLTWPDDVAIVCNYLKITKFSILAHSAGAIYALATALRIPQHIRGRIHLLAPWIPPSQMTNLGTHKEPLPNNAVPYSQRILRALPTPILKVANSSFMNATSSSITTSLPKSPRRNKRKSFGRETVAPTMTELTSPSNNASNNATTNQAKVDRNSTLTTATNATTTPLIAHDQRNSTFSQTSALNRPSAAEEAAILASQQKERQTEYDTRLTHRIWELATTNANPAVDLLICLERRQTIGFRYVDINREVVIHHGTKDTRVPVDNVRWLGKTMRRCEVRVLEGEGHGLMASAVVMSNVLTEMAKEWEDWTTVVQGRGRGRRTTVSAATHHYPSSRSGVVAV